MNKSTKLNDALLDHGPHPAPTLHDALPAVASFLTHPDEVISHPELTEAEKRLILASWVSDARAVVNAPALRQLDNGAVVEVAEVLHALRSLDDARTLFMGRQQAFKARPAFARRRRTQVSLG